MIGAIEKQKLVYILNRDAQARLTISSPLEAHKANTFVYHCVGVDVGFENPMFACLEVDYEEVDNDPSGIDYLKIVHMNFFLNYTYLVLFVLFFLACENDIYGNSFKFQEKLPLNFQ